MVDYQHVVAVHADDSCGKKRNWIEMEDPHFSKYLPLFLIWIMKVIWQLLDIDIVFVVVVIFYREGRIL